MFDTKVSARMSRFPQLFVSMMEVHVHGRYWTYLNACFFIPDCLTEEILEDIKGKNQTFQMFHCLCLSILIFCWAALILYVLYIWINHSAHFSLSFETSVAFSVHLLCWCVLWQFVAVLWLSSAADKPFKMSCWGVLMPARFVCTIWFHFNV